MVILVTNISGNYYQKYIKQPTMTCVGINGRIKTLFNIILWYLVSRGGSRNTKIASLYSIHKAYLYAKNNGKCLIDQGTQAIFSWAWENFNNLGWSQLFILNSRSNLFLTKTEQSSQPPYLKGGVIFQLKGAHLSPRQ